MESWSVVASHVWVECRAAPELLVWADSLPWDLGPHPWGGAQGLAPQPGWAPWTLDPPSPANAAFPPSPPKLNAGKQRIS